MNESVPMKPGRREFLGKFLPACGLTCFGASRLFSTSPEMVASLLQEEKHRWDKPMEFPAGRELTLRTFQGIRIREFVNFVRFLEKEMGKEKALELVKKATTEDLTRYGKSQAQRFGKTDLKSYTAQFKGPGMQNGLTYEIVEDTDKVFEIKVSECLICDAYLQAKAGDIGYAAVCWGDYAWAEGFNPKIKLVRDKTLMEGQSYCNHKYIMTD
jgi:hypothetical protein